MPLPEQFSEWEHLQAQIRRLHNRTVRDWFRDAIDDDISTVRSSLKHACLIKDDDSAIHTLLRLWLFEFNAGHSQALQTPVYGMPVQEFQRDRKFRPQVKLYFKEPRDFLDPEERGSRQSEGEITFRLMNETSETITRFKAEQLATRIRQEFATPLYVWRKGWFKCTYKDIDRGYDLRILARSRQEGVEVIRKVLDIQNHVFDDDNFQFIDHDRVYSNNSGTHRVYGETVKKPIRRPRADVRFLHAQLLIWGRPKPVNLVAHGSRLKEVIEYV
ncbi:MAG: hypothetical protein F6K19_35070 [Cyanothece sp. SIO1E1]|nr:hypothetical protein [Cyanothece sp. SIO1E1]